MPVSSNVVDKDFADAVVLEENCVRICGGNRAASSRIGCLAPVRADDCVVLVVPVVGKAVKREAIVSVNNVVCGASGVD